MCILLLSDFLFNFNSIKVRLELLKVMILIKSLSDFNSIKVRLEHEIV